MRIVLLLSWLMNLVSCWCCLNRQDHASILAPRQQADPFGEVVIQEIEENHFRVSGLVRLRPWQATRNRFDREGVNTVRVHPEEQRAITSCWRYGEGTGYLLTVVEAEEDGIWIDIGRMNGRKSFHDRCFTVVPAGALWSFSVVAKRFYRVWRTSYSRRIEWVEGGNG